MKKKLQQITFMEFLEEAKKEGIEREVMEGFKHEVFEILHKEAFSDKQILEMKMERLYSFLVEIGEKYAMLWDITSQRLKNKQD